MMLLPHLARPQVHRSEAAACWVNTQIEGESWVTAPWMLPLEAFETFSEQCTMRAKKVKAVFMTKYL